MADRVISQKRQAPVCYTIEEHRHRFAAWAAGRAASVKGCRFSVEQAQKILESSGLKDLLSDPDRLPEAMKIDKKHREWRNSVIKNATAAGLSFTDGVAAKLINIYLKAGFVCGGHHQHNRVRTLHPPIDNALLKELAKQNVGGARQEWKKAAQIRWSKFTSNQYDAVIKLIRNSIPNHALWEIEQYWRGYQ